MDVAYRVTLHDRDGSAIDEYQVEYEDDGAAVAGTALLDCPNEMRVWQGERLVAVFTYRSSLPAAAKGVSAPTARRPESRACW
jgi:hypothetical protein